MNPLNNDPNTQQEEDEPEIDWSEVYGGIDIDVNDYEPSEELKNSYADMFKEAVQQFPKETLIGIGGTYGDLAELVGLQGKEKTARNPRSEQEFDILQKINQPGYQPSQEELETLTAEEDLSKTAPKLPTSTNLRALSDALGGPGEPETAIGKGAARSGKLYGGGVAFGQINPIPAVAGGIVGQGVEELGGGPLAQAAAEIVTMIATQGRSGPSGVSSSKQALQKKIQDLRNLGYTEEDITLAINAANKNSKSVQRKISRSSKGSKSQQAFEDFTEHSDDMVNNILSAEIPGIERGTKYVHELASDAYDVVVQKGKTLPIKNSAPFEAAVANVEAELARTLGKNEAAQPFLNRLEGAVADAKKNPSADSYMAFYRELNALGSWMGRSQKDRLIGKVKDGIKDTFRAEGKQGKQLADDFEKVNAGIQKAYKAEDIHNLIQKTTSQSGIDYNKLHKVFDKKENVKLFEEVLGKDQTRNLNLISKTGKEVKDFDKAWKAAGMFIPGTKGDLVRSGAALYCIYQGDYAGLAAVLASKGARALTGKIAEKSLTDPRYQNIIIRGLHAIKNGSPKALKSANEAMQKYFDEQGIDIELD